jgi:HD-like signal output (HDOD) protein
VVQGFFFQDWFERIINNMGDKTTFSKAEGELGGAISHEWIGELVLRKSDMPSELVNAVGLHHVLGDKPEPMTALVHVADSITKELGLGLVEGESVEYNRTALQVLGMKRDDARNKSKEYADSVKEEVGRLVRDCMS